VYSAEDHAHAVHRRTHLLEIAHIGADAQGGAAGVLNFEFGQVQFRLAPGEQTDPRAGRGKPQRQPFAHTAARPGDQDPLLLQRMHRAFTEGPA